MKGDGDAEGDGDGEVKVRLRSMWHDREGDDTVPLPLTPIGIA